jgi:hypothetical protein
MKEPKSKDPNDKTRTIDRDRKHDVSNESRDQADDPKRASNRAATGGQGQPGGHGPTTPGTPSEPDAPH